MASAVGSRLVKLMKTRVQIVFEQNPTFLLSLRSHNQGHGLLEIHNFVTKIKN